MNLSLSWHYFDAGVSDLFLPPPRSICCIAALSFDDQKGGSFGGYIDPVRIQRAHSSVSLPHAAIYEHWKLFLFIDRKRLSQKSPIKKKLSRLVYEVSFSFNA